MSNFQKFATFFKITFMAVVLGLLGWGFFGSAGALAGIGLTAVIVFLFQVV